MPLCKFCAIAGCNTVIPATATYCKRHNKTKAERNKEYDTARRDKAAKAFYNSTAWKETRRRVLVIDHGIDLYIYATEGRVVRATLVHHIIEYKDDATKALDINNLISVSEETHEGTIKRAYANEQSKKEMQQCLFNIIKHYRERKG